MSEAMRKRSEIEVGRRERLALGLTAACSVALSGGVIASLIYLLLAFASSMATRPAFAQTAAVGAGVRLEAGIEKEDVDGDLKSAMDIYQKIASDTSAPRDVRAKALLRLAGCDEKLGKQAKQVYEEIVRDYADQPPAAQARSRLAALKQQEHPAPPNTMSVRKIETLGLGNIYSWTTDGERAIYQASDSNLYFGDLTGHSKRLVFKAEPGLISWAPSKDFSVVLLVLQPDPKGLKKVAMVNIDGTGYRELIHDDAERTIFGGTVNLSWDKRYLVFAAPSDGRSDSRLLMVSVADGQRRELARTEAGNISRATFSPDGRFVAYEVMPMPSEVKSGTCRIFVIPAQGGEPQQVYDSKPWKAGGLFHAYLDWTADGRYLAIQDISRDGRPALFLLPMKDGAATGDAAMVRFGEIGAAFTTASGALVFHETSTRPPESDVFLAPLNSEGHVGRWQRLDLRGGRFPNGDRSPSFSSDGSELSYLAPGTGAGKTDLVLREVSSGRERVLYQLSGGDINCQFASSSSAILCASSKNDGKTELVSVAVESGKTEHLSSFDQKRIILQHSADDATFYFDSTSYEGLACTLQWDMAARKETILATGSERDEDFTPSPDGKWLVRTRPSELSVRRMSGGDWTSLVSETNVIGRQSVVSPDSKWFIFHEYDQSGENFLSRVSITGGKPERLGDFPSPSSSGYLSVSPDGRQILAICFGGPADNLGVEVWVLDDYVPHAKK